MKNPRAKKSVPLNLASPLRPRRVCSLPKGTACGRLLRFLLPVLAVGFTMTGALRAFAGRALTPPVAPAAARPAAPSGIRVGKLRRGRSQVRAQGLKSHLLVGYWQTYVNGAVVIPLGQVSPEYDVIDVAFGMPASGTGVVITLSIDPSIETNDQFIADIATLHKQGQSVVLSIGGASSLIKLTSQKKVKKFVNSVAALITQYGFDGVDIDFEGNSLKLAPGDSDFKNPKTPEIVNLISGLHTLDGMFEGDLIITFAPATFNVQAGYTGYHGAQGSYLPVIYGTRDILSWVQTQDYNSGTMFGLDGNIYTGGTSDFHVAMTEFLLQGFPIDHDTNNFFPALGENQVTFGVPASVQAASTSPPSFATPSDVQNALNYLINGIPYEGHQYTLINSAGYPEMRGLMTYSINWDLTNGSAMSNQIGPFLHGLPGE
ncbi:MAG TPA: chitinase [Blastocatellia bacterium]